MHTPPSRPHLSRRSFLKLLAAGGATAAGGYVLYETAPWLNYDQQVASLQRTIDVGAPGPAHLRELVRAATLAANGHNTQPWRFALTNDTITIRPDAARRLAVVDPHDRELWISLGCALENLLVAARALGYAPEVTYPESVDAIAVRLAPGSAQAGPLPAAIPLRQNTRSLYDGRPIPMADLDQVQTLPLEPGVVLQVLTSAAERETVLEYVTRGNLQQYADKAFVAELIAWLRFNKREALATLDGLYTRCAGKPEVPRWLGQRFVAGTQPQQQADADAAKLRSAPAVAVIASTTDDRVAWVRTGQVYERLALTTTALNIRSALLNQPVEVAVLRAQFQQALGLRETLPQLVIRMGYAGAMPRSPRRPVAQVLAEAGAPA
ncbi:MAG: twin-arginine translocation signal domain-containing protein [Chloroflexi bacterium]|nr:twin-arginine translocation signal domain-containing protein [Chloroflexota bacterium]